MGVSLTGLTKVYDTDEGEVTAVEDLSVEIKDGEFVVFVGPSGCGKTTTLRCIAGLETPTEGEIHLNGERIDQLPPQERDIAMVFQNYALYPHLSVRDNMGFGLKNRTQLSKEQINRQVEETAQMMGIESLLENNPDQLSGGQQQRVATGRAIVRDPELFLFDEPLSNLDAKLRKHMRTEIQSIQEDFGTTSIYVTHDQEEAMTMADRIAVLRDARLQQIGKPTEIYNNPANRFVAGFIGEPSMNFFDVTRDGNELLGDAVEYEISEMMVDALGSETELTLGIRPEDIRIQTDGAIETEMELLEELGDINLVYVKVGDRQATIKTDPDVMPNIGDTVYLEFPEEHIYLFDAASGDTIISGGKTFERQSAKA